MIKAEYSPLIEKNLDYIRNNNYDILLNGHQLYKKMGNFEILITDYSSRPFEIDLWYIISIDVWIKDCKTDIILKSKHYSGNFFFPKMKKIEKYLERSIKEIDQSGED